MQIPTNLSFRRSLTRFSVLLGAVLVSVFIVGSAQAQLFSWGNRPLFRSMVQKAPVSHVTKSTVRPVSGYGSNFHRNFTIRQQQQRVESGQALQNRNNVLWTR